MGSDSGGWKRWPGSTAGSAKDRRGKARCLNQTLKIHRLHPPNRPKTSAGQSKRRSMSELWLSESTGCSEKRHGWSVSAWDGASHGRGVIYDTGTLSAGLVQAGTGSRL